MGNCLHKRQILNQLRNATNDVKLSTLDGESYICKVVYVYDGDTVHIVISQNGNLVKYICRLSNIDTPELKVCKKNRTETSVLNEKNEAIKARNYLIEKITGKKITNPYMTRTEIKSFCETSNKLSFVKCHKFDKYGRLLVEIFENANSVISLNTKLINENLAVEYDGGTKKCLF